MTNYSHGHDAEKVAARYLEVYGYTIITLNWRHTRAEIDIIAQKRPLLRAKGPLVFFEVKYRKTDAQGSGLDYITPKKLAQMRFAAELWVAENRYEGDYTLGAMEVTGETYEITNFLENIN
jgi:putative endonuclease